MSNEINTLPITVVEIEKLKPYDKNAKKHSAEQVNRLAEQIKRHGFDQPIVVWPDRNGNLVIVKGHGRHQALLKLGAKKVPVIVRDDLSKEQADAMRIADNALSSVEYDTKMLAEETRKLLDMDLGLDKMDFGFSDKDASMFIESLNSKADDIFVEDVSASIRDQKEEDAERVSAIDDEKVKITDIFKAKTVNTRQARAITLWLADLEDETGEEGILALVKKVTEK